MKKQNSRIFSGFIGITCAVAAFIFFSIAAGGLVELSKDVGLALWLKEVLLYSFSNKFAYKLVASLVIGFGAYFATNMILYSKAMKAKKASRATRVIFTQNDPTVGKSA